MRWDWRGCPEGQLPRRVRRPAIGRGRAGGPPRSKWDERSENARVYGKNVMSAENAGGVSIMSRNGAPSRKECVVNDQTTKTNHECEYPPSHPPSLPSSLSLIRCSGRRMCQNLSERVSTPSSHKVSTYGLPLPPCFAPVCALFPPPTRPTNEQRRFAGICQATTPSSRTNTQCPTQTSPQRTPGESHVCVHRLNYEHKGEKLH